MMKIYINGRFLTQRLTGVQKFAYQYTNELFVQYKDNLIVLIPQKSKINNFYKKKFNVKHIGSNSGHLWEQFDLPIYLRRINNPLLISFTNSNPCFYKNKITTIHDLSIYVNINWYSIYYRFFYKIILPLIINNSLKVITVSNFSKNEILDKFSINKDKIMVLYNCVIPSSQKKYNNDKEKYLLFIGSNNDRKNLKNLLLAFLELKNLNLNLKLVGININDLPMEYRSINRIECLGYVNNEKLDSYYVNAFALISPSLYEGFGIPLIEAMRNKCPLLVSDINVYKEVCGNAAIYFNPYDINDIKNNIEYLYNSQDLIPELINLGQEQLKNFNIKHQVKKLIKNIQICDD